MTKHGLFERTFTFPKHYQIIKVNDEPRLFCRQGGEWFQDRECESINEMLEQRLIAESTVKGWIAAQEA